MPFKEKLAPNRWTKRVQLSKFEATKPETVEWVADGRMRRDALCLAKGECGSCKAAAVYLAAIHTLEAEAMNRPRIALHDEYRRA